MEAYVVVQRGFFDLDARYAALSAAGDPLEKSSTLIDPANTGSAIWADTAYRSQKSARAILRAGLVSKIHFRRAPGKPLPTQRQRANAARSKIRSAVEHVFATQKHRMGLFIRTIGIKRARAKIGLANIAFNFKRFLYWETRSSTA